MKYEETIKNFPKQRMELPPEYIAIYDQHHKENRNGTTKVSFLSQKLEAWMHRMVAKTGTLNQKTLEIGAGTLNQLDYERCEIYDVVEPYEKLFEESPNRKYVRNTYRDISCIQGTKQYQRIISIACFEHICNLTEVVERCTELMEPNGVVAVAIPNEGRFLWRFAYKMTSGIEFKRRFGLDYEIMMRYEHVNSADEIEAILKHYFKDVKCSLLGISKTFSLYRYYECRCPRIRGTN